MKINLIFDDWREDGKSIYNTEKGVALSLHDFHSGSTFKGEIELTEEQECELIVAETYANVEPVFRVTISREDK